MYVSIYIPTYYCMYVCTIISMYVVSPFTIPDFIKFTYYDVSYTLTVLLNSTIVCTLYCNHSNV